MGFFKKKYILTSAVFFAVSSVLCAKNFSFNLIPYFAVETSVIEEGITTKIIQNTLTKCAVFLNGNRNRLIYSGLKAFLI